MARKIKFRAWDKEKKQMINLPFGKNMFWYEEECYDDFEDDWEVMQYTHLKDSKGCEIYEGDILQFSRNDNMIGEHILRIIVKWDENKGGFIGLNTWLQDSYDGKIIGNVWENPELLKQ